MDEVLSSRATPSSALSAKRARSSAPGSSRRGSAGHSGPAEAEFGDVPPSSLIDVHSPLRECTSTAAARAEGLAPSFGGVGGPSRYPDSRVPSGSSLRSLSRAKGKLCDLVTGAEAQEVAALGLEGMIDTAVEGFGLVCPLLPPCFILDSFVVLLTCFVS